MSLYKFSPGNIYNAYQKGSFLPTYERIILNVLSTDKSLNSLIHTWNINLHPLIKDLPDLNTNISSINIGLSSESIYLKSNSTELDDYYNFSKSRPYSIYEFSNLINSLLTTLTTLISTSKTTVLAFANRYIKNKYIDLRDTSNFYQPLSLVSYSQVNNYLGYTLFKDLNLSTSSTYVGLNDTPNALIAEKILAVNSLEDGQDLQSFGYVMRPKITHVNGNYNISSLAIDSQIEGHHVLIVHDTSSLQITIPSTVEYITGATITIIKNNNANPVTLIFPGSIGLEGSLSNFILPKRSITLAKTNSNYLRIVDEGI